MHGRNSMHQCDITCAILAVTYSQFGLMHNPMFKKDSDFSGGFSE